MKWQREKNKNPAPASFKFPDQVCWPVELNQALTIHRRADYLKQMIVLKLKEVNSQVCDITPEVI